MCANGAPVLDELEGYDSDDSFFPIPEKINMGEFDDGNSLSGQSSNGANGMKRSGSVESKLSSFLQVTEVAPFVLVFFSLWIFLESTPHNFFHCLVCSPPQNPLA